VTTWIVVYEHGPTSWGAYVPALPGLGAVGDTRAEVEQLIREGIVFHLEGLADDGLPIPDPGSVEVEAVSIYNLPNVRPTGKARRVGRLRGRPRSGPSARRPPYRGRISAEHVLRSPRSACGARYYVANPGAPPTKEAGA